MGRVEALEAARRRHIIDCTIRVVARHGLANTSLSRVAREAKVAKGIICYYFTSKDGLFEAVMERLRERTFLAAVARAESGEDAWAQLCSFVAAQLRQMRERRHDVLVMRHLAVGAAAVGEQQLVVQREQRDWLASILIEGQHSGAFRQFDVEMVAGAIAGAIDGGLDQLAQDPKVDIDRYSTQLLALFEPGVRETGLHASHSDASLLGQAPQQEL